MAVNFRFLKLLANLGHPKGKYHLPFLKFSNKEDDYGLSALYVLKRVPTKNLYGSCHTMYVCVYVTVRSFLLIVSDFEKV